ncbi:MAG: cytidylate kinase family protein, partial [Deltaproteobacteria bacterium]|nr:cytidylate kinase family protein [Deltaproteobacteria bacterium]
MSVITISRQLGSLGTEVAQAVANRLNYQYVDKEKIGKALSGYGLPALQIEKFDEKKPPFWNSFQMQKSRFQHCLAAVIYDFARKGKAVIVGRGGQVLLRNLPGVLHVRMVAPLEVRLKRIMTLEGGDEKKSTQILHRSDRDSAGFLHSFFDTDWEEQSLYDLIINTHKLSVDCCVQMIVESILSPEIKEGEKRAEEKLADLALAQKLEAILMATLEVDFRNVTVQSKGGVVNISGHVNSELLKADCLRA